jgi:hypothetical protein
MASWIGLTSRTLTVNLNEITPWQRREMLGAVGEGIARRFFNSQGLTVIMSEDKYDDVKDMTVNGKTVEIKTLLPIYKFNSFCLPVKQSKSVKK